MSDDVLINGKPAATEDTEAQDLGPTLDQCIAVIQQAGRDFDRSIAMYEYIADLLRDNNAPIISFPTGLTDSSTGRQVVHEIDLNEVVSKLSKTVDDSVALRKQMLMPLQAYMFVRAKHAVNQLQRYSSRMLQLLGDTVT
jgi:hypothetical protein